MRLLVLSLYYEPDLAANAAIITRICRGLTQRGHEVSVVTTHPHYITGIPTAPAGRSRQHRVATDSPNPSDAPQASLGVSPPPWSSPAVARTRSGRSGPTTDLSAAPRYSPAEWVVEDGVRVRRLSPPPGSRLADAWLRRLGSWSFSTVWAFLAGRQAGRCDLVLTPSPPLALGLAGGLLARTRGVPFVYNVQDIQPDVAVAAGVLRNPLLIRSLHVLERVVYRLASRITVLSEDFAKNLRAKGVPAQKLRVIPNFVDLDFVRPLPRTNALSTAWQLDGRFVVLYAGNVGISQDFETVLTAAAHLRQREDIRFLIVGDGGLRPWLEQAVAERELPNVELRPFVPRRDVPWLYASCDVALVPLKPGIARTSVPSKVYTIMAAARPVILSAEAESAVAGLVQASSSGLLVTPGDPDAHTEALLRLYHSEADRSAMRRSARHYAEQHLHPDGVIDQYEALLTELTPPQ